MKKLICMVLALVMLLAMAACADENKEAYEQAVAAYNSGDYETASTMLSGLGDYKDAAQLLASISVEKTGAAVEVTTADGTAATNVEYIYKDGNLIKENITHADGAVIKNYYKYDENNLCTSETLNHRDTGKTVVNHLYENGAKVKTIRTNPDKSKDTYEFTCDESGKILSHVLTLSDGTVEEATYSYNEAGQLSVISTATGTTTYEYNAFGDVVKEAVSKNGEVVSATTYSYAYIFVVV